MTLKTYNKVTVPQNIDAFRPTSDLKNMAESSRVTIEIGSDAEQAALPSLAPGGALPVGTAIIRTDDPTLPVRRWDGTKWVQYIYAEASASTTNAGSGAGWGVGPLIISPANSSDQTFVSFPEADCIRFTQAGLYSVSIHVKASAALSGFIKGTIQSSNGASVYGQEYPTPTATEFVISAPVIYFPTAGGQVFGKLLHNSGANRNFTSIARILKIG